MMSIITNQPEPITTVIGCDSGNKLVKTASSITLAGIQKLPNRPAVAPPDPMDLLLINGQYYVVSNKRLAYERDKSINENHLYLTLIAVAKEMQARHMNPTSKIVLAVGLPPGHMASAKLAQTYRDYFLKDGGVYRFQCGGVSHQITISDVIVCPQAYSILLTLSPEIIRQPSIHVVDIGGGTVDTVHLVNGRPDPNMSSLDMGVIPMYNSIQLRLQNEFGRRITEDQIDDIIKGKPGFFKPEHVRVVMDVAEAHVKAIFDEYREAGEDWMSSYVVFCGGGSILLKPFIEKYAAESTGSYVVVNDLKANAKGFETFARTLLKGQK